MDQISTLKKKKAYTKYIVSRDITILGIVCDSQTAKFFNMMNETKLKINIFFHRSFQNMKPGTLLRVKNSSLLKTNL